MSDASEPESRGAKPKKPFFGPTRIVLWIVILAALVAIFFEWRARQAFTNTREAVEKAWAEAEKEGGGLYKDDVEKLLAGSPKRETPAPRTEVFTWSSLLKSYQMRLEYGAGDFVQKVEAQ